MIKTQNGDANHLRWQEGTGFGIRLSDSQDQLHIGKWRTGLDIDGFSLVKT